MRECAECGDGQKAVAPDPRSPPLDDGYCLCAYCAVGAYTDAIEAAEREVERLREDAETFGVRHAA